MWILKKLTTNKEYSRNKQNAEINYRSCILVTATYCNNIPFVSFALPCWWEITIVAKWFTQNQILRCCPFTVGFSNFALPFLVSVIMNIKETYQPCQPNSKFTKLWCSLVSCMVARHGHYTESKLNNLKVSTWDHYGTSWISGGRIKLQICSARQSQRC